MKPLLFVAILPLLAMGQENIATAPPASTPRAERPARPPQKHNLPEGTVVHKDIAYIKDGHERNKLDLFLPAADASRPLPLVIWVHGGAWRAGSKENCPALRLLGEGYAVASINYRLTDAAIFPAQIQDCKTAVRWLRSHAADYGLNPEKFAAWGSSAGGHLVALLGTTGDDKSFDLGDHLDVSAKVQAVVDFFGPTDFTKMEEQDAPYGKMDHDSPEAPEALLIGGPVQENKEKAALANPCTYASKEDPPMLIVHGDMDPLVPHAQSILLEEALKKAGTSVELHIVKGGGHGDKFGPDVARKVDAFLARHLKPIKE